MARRPYLSTDDPLTSGMAEGQQMFGRYADPMFNTMIQANQLQRQAQIDAENQRRYEAQLGLREQEVARMQAQRGEDIARAQAARLEDQQAQYDTRASAILSKIALVPSYDDQGRVVGYSLDPAKVEMARPLIEQMLGPRPGTEMPVAEPVAEPPPGAEAVGVDQIPTAEPLAATRLAPQDEAAMAAEYGPDWRERMMDTSFAAGNGQPGQLPPELVASNDINDQLSLYNMVQSRRPAPTQGTQGPTPYGNIPFAQWPGQFIQRNIAGPAVKAWGGLAQAGGGVYSALTDMPASEGAGKIGEAIYGDYFENMRRKTASEGTPYDPYYQDIRSAVANSDIYPAEAIGQVGDEYNKYYDAMRRAATEGTPYSPYYQGVRGMVAGGELQDKAAEAYDPYYNSVRSMVAGGELQDKAAQVGDEAYGKYYRSMRENVAGGGNPYDPYYQSVRGMLTKQPRTPTRKSTRSPYMKLKSQ